MSDAARPDTRQTSEGSSAEVAELTPKNFDEKIKEAICNQLEDDPNGREVLALNKMKRWFGGILVPLAAAVPLAMLGILAWSLLYGCGGFHNMDKWAQVVYVSGSFLSFVVIYAVLIKGMFSHGKEENSGEFSAKDAAELLRELRSGDN